MGPFLSECIVPLFKGYQMRPFLSEIIDTFLGFVLSYYSCLDMFGHVLNMFGHVFYVGWLFSWLIYDV